jgi:hypothetical protein
MEAQQRIQDRKRAFRYAQPWPRGADRAKDLPLMDHFVRWPCGSGHLRCHMGKRQHSPPEGRRWLTGLHDFAFYLGKENLLAESALVSHETLDCELRK